MLTMNHPLERNKIGDEWDSIPYRFIDKLQDSVCVVQRVDGTGKTLGVLSYLAFLNMVVMLRTAFSQKMGMKV